VHAPESRPADGVTRMVALRDGSRRGGQQTAEAEDDRSHLTAPSQQARLSMPRARTMSVALYSPSSLSRVAPE
jgi:hypothetical protein